MECIKRSVKSCSFCGAISMVIFSVMIILNFVALGFSERDMVTSAESIYVITPYFKTLFEDDSEKAAVVLQWLIMTSFTFCMLCCTGCSACFGCMVFAFRDDRNKIFALCVGCCFCIPILPLILVYTLYLCESFLFSFIRIFTSVDLDVEIIFGLLTFHCCIPCCFCYCCCLVCYSSVTNIIWDVLECVGIVRTSGHVKVKFKNISDDGEDRDRLLGDELSQDNHSSTSETQQQQQRESLKIDGSEFLDDRRSEHEIVSDIIAKNLQDRGNRESFIGMTDGIQLSEVTQEVTIE